MGQLQTTLEQLAAAEAEQASRGAERLSMVEAATAAGLADVSARLGKIDALAEAVNTLAARETEHPQDAAPTPPSAFTERAVTLSSGRLAILLVPVEARRVVLLVPDVTPVDSDATTDPLRQVAEYLAARGSVVLRFDPEAAFEESLTTALGALDALLIQPETAGMGVTLVAYAESVGIAVAEARPEVVNLVLLDPTARPAEPTQRLRQAVQVLGPIDQDALEAIQSWITAQDSPSP